MANAFVDQFLLYDQALITWLQQQLPPLLPGTTTQMVFATPKRRYAEVTTGRVIDNKTLAFPRISISRQDPVIHEQRFSSPRIRKLGYTDASCQKIITGEHPAPINLAYQVDLWTTQVSQMNLWLQRVLFRFKSQYIYLQIRPDDIWQNKKYIVFLDGGITDNSELDPGAEGDRQIRKTVQLRAECWLFDQELTPVRTVKTIETLWGDTDEVTDYDRTFLPPYEIATVGNGVAVTFGPLTLLRPPVLPRTLLIQTVIGGTSELAQDDNSGNIVGPRTTGTVVYSTGVINLTFDDPPDNLAEIKATYFTDQGA